MFALRTIVALACVGIAAAVHTCPADPGLSMDVDQDTGVWYMVAGSPVRGNKVSSCSQFNVSRVADDELAMEFTALSYRTNNTVVFDIKALVAENGITATWRVRGSPRILGPFWHVVVHRDEQFLITIVCSDEFIPYVPNGKFSMVWSRERYPSAADMEDLETKLAEYIEKERIVIIPQENC